MKKYKNKVTVEALPDSPSQKQVFNNLHKNFDITENILENAIKDKQKRGK